MRPTHEIVEAVRLGERPDYEELRRTVVAFDVMLSWVDVSRFPEVLQAWFAMAEADPVDFVGPENDPDSPQCVAWYREMMKIPERTAPAPRVCSNCGECVPPGCGGLFAEPGAGCLLATAAGRLGAP